MKIVSPTCSYGQEQPVTEETASQVLTEMLMDFAELHGTFPKAHVDPRAWEHALAYYGLSKLEV